MKKARKRCRRRADGLEVDRPGGDTVRATYNQKEYVLSEDPPRFTVESKMSVAYTLAPSSSDEILLVDGLGRVVVRVEVTDGAVDMIVSDGEREKTIPCSKSKTDPRAPALVHVVGERIVAKQVGVARSSFRITVQAAG